MDFLSDYWMYHACYETNRNFVFWSGISLLQAILHRKVHFLLGDVEIHPMDYVLLVSPQGAIKKDLCTGFATDVFKLACPDLELGANTQSAEDIVKIMSQSEFGTTFKNHAGEIVRVKPLAFFITEFKNFIPYNAVRMVNFLTAVYDKKFFDSSTIIRGKEAIINPCINILASENPDQFGDLMKTRILTGGFSRRIIPVYETKAHRITPRPFITVEARSAWERIKQRAKDVTQVVGEFKWTTNGEKFFEQFYIEKSKQRDNETNPMISGFIGTKDIHLLKVCMALDCASDKPMLLFTDELLQLGLALLDATEDGMRRLYASGGRNELAPSYAKIIEILLTNGGMIPEKVLRRMLQNEMDPMEIYNTLRHLIETDQIVKEVFGLPNSKGEKVRREMIILPDKFAEMKMKGEIV